MRLEPVDPMRRVLPGILVAAFGAVVYLGWRTWGTEPPEAPAASEPAADTASPSPVANTTPSAPETAVPGAPARAMPAIRSPQPSGVRTAATPAISSTPEAATAGRPKRRDWDPDFLTGFQHVSSGAPVRFELTDGIVGVGTVRRVERRNGEVVSVTGRLTAPEAGRFFFQEQTEPGLQGAFAGLVELPESMTAWRIEPAADGGGSVLVSRRLEEVICLMMPLPDASAAAVPEDIPPLDPSDHPDYPIPAYQEGILPLQSLPGSPAVLYLDYRGGYNDNNWGSFPYSRPNVSNAQIKDVWKRVAEDFIPFNINVTTDLAVYQAARETRRQRVVVTPTNTAAPGAGGVAWLNSWNWSGDIPCWAFYTTGKSAAEVISHEAGHTLTLSHDGRTSPSETYFGGHGSGALAWAPIMGVGYSKPVVQWSRGEYANANNTEDDLARIVGNNNDVNYRADDTGDTLATARYLDVYADTTVFAEGVVERTGDTDAFRFTTRGGAVSLRADPAPGAWADLAIMATLADDADTIMATSNPQDQLGASIDTTLAAGTYTFRVTGAGRNNPLTDGFTSYASLGYYEISGSVADARLPTRFSVVENSANATVVGTVPATNLEVDPLVYNITSGNTDGAFALDHDGVLTVANSAALNYEALALNSQLTVQYELLVDITNTVNPDLTELNRRVVVAILDANEPPTATGFTNTILTGTAPGTIIGTVTGTDEDYYTVLDYSILSGNSNAFFAVGSEDGVFTLAGGSTPVQEGVYDLQVQVSDDGASSVANVHVTVRPNYTPFQPGTISYTVYDDIGSGNLVSDLTGHSRYPADPTWEQQRTLLEGDTDRANAYGSVMRGYLIPPLSGTYTFWIATDDNGELRLGTTTNAASARVIARIAGNGNWAAPREWDKITSQQSDPVFLDAGQGYYIEALQKEGGGGDNLAVAWRGPATENQTRVIPGLFLAPAPMNYLPHATGFTVNVRRNLFPGARLGRVSVTDQNADDRHHFSILSGNAEGIFGVDAEGFVSVTNDAALAATDTPSFTLAVQVTDSGSPPLSATATVVLNITPADGITTTGLQREMFYNLGSGNGVADLTGSAKFPGKPDALSELSDFSSPEDVADNYGSRIRAYVVPPVTGDYQFFVASDDDSQLKFSPDTNPAASTVIASVSGWTDPESWTEFASQASPVQTGLVAGRRYYIEVLQKEGGGGDHVSVGWLLPGSGATSVIPAARLEPVDINHAPQIGGQVLGVSQAIANGDTVGDLGAADSPMDVLTFRLISGNTNNTFALDPASGRLTVADNTLIAGGSQSGFQLNVAVQDSGYGGLFPLRAATGTVSVVVAPPGSYAEAVVTNSPVAYWRLGELSGTTAYDMLGGNHGTYSDVILRQRGALGSDPDRSVRCNGSSSFVGTGQRLASDRAAFTMEGWFRLNASPTKMGFWGQNNAIEFGLINSATLQAWTPGGGSVNVPYTWGVRSWHHLAVVGNGADLRIYVDGDLVGTGGTATENYGASAYPFNIGGGGIWDADGNWFNGWLDEVAFYDKALPAAEMQRHYLLGLPLPVVTMTTPTNNASFTAPADIQLAADVTANGHTIASVRFYDGAALLGEDTSPPYSHAWLGVGPGTADLKAVVIYDTGSVTGTAATVTIVDPAPPAFLSVTMEGAGFTLSGNGAVGQTYLLLATSNLPPPVVWSPVATNVAGMDGTVIFLDPLATHSPQRFYRLGTP